MTSEVSGDEVLASLRKWPGWDVEAGLRLSHQREERFLRMLHIFQESHCASIARMREELAAGDVETARRTVHSIKGAAALVGATQLNLWAAELEQAILAGGSAKSIEPLATAIDAEMAVLRGILMGA